MPVARDVNGNPLPYVRPNGPTFEMTNSTSGFFGANTTLIRVAASAEARIAIGTSPSVTASSLLIPAGCVDYFPVQPGERVVCSGTVNVAECG